MRLFITSLLLITSFFTFAQHQKGDKNFKNMPPKGSVSGRIINSETNKPIDYANIALYRKKDSSLLTGTITNRGGWFSLDKIPFGMYYLEIKFLGFKKEQTKSFKITPKNKDVLMTKIKLKELSTQINEVNVTEDRNHIQYKLDKKIVNVSQDINATGGSAVDVLENTPSVQTDIDGNVSLRGSSNFMVLIDGKPTIFESSDALKQIPSSTIEKIEIITNPSAKYDPDGIGGIINVILKKNVLQGLNGIITASAGTHDKYSGDITLAYKTNKINVFGGIQYSDYTSYSSGIMSRESILNDTIFNMNFISDRKRKRGRNSIKAGFDYYINPTSTLSFSSSLGKMGFGRFSDANYHEFETPGIFDNYYVRTNDFDINRTYYKINLDYEKKFNEDGEILSIGAFTSKGDGYNNEYLDENTSNSDWTILYINSLQQKTINKSANNDFRLKADYTLPLKNDGKIETGYQVRLSSRTLDYNLEQLDSLKIWNSLEEFVNNMDYTRDIQSIYLIASGKLNIFEYQTGLRTEYTNRNLTQNATGESYPINRFDWFPSIHLSLGLSDKNQIQTSYSRRINRPREWYLNPFKNYLDPHNIRTGNPALEPEYIDSYELNFQHKFNRSFVSIESYYRKTNNKINRIRILGDDNIMYHSFANLDKDQSKGIELMANLQLAKWWRFTATSNLFNYSIEGNIEDMDVSQVTNTWSLRINSTFKLKWKTRIQITGYYSGPSVTAQGNRDGFYFTNLGIKQDILKNKANITLQVRDIFGTMKHSFTSVGDNFTLSNEFNREPRVVTLQFSYLINNYKKSQSNRNGNGMDFDNGNL